MRLIYAYILFQKIIQKYVFIPFKIVWQVCKVGQSFGFEYKINKTIEKVSTQYQGLHSFLMIFLLSLNFLVSFGMCSTRKLSKYVILLSFTYEATLYTHQDLLYKPRSSQCLLNYFMNKHP